jgi:transposase
MHYKAQQDREQLMIISYDTMISQDNPVRLIDLMVNKFISQNQQEEGWKGNKKEGRKSYPPSSMLSLLVYGYFDGTSSSRKLETGTYRNIELLWLMGSLHPDHWTICEFRRNNGKLIRNFLKTFRKFLLDESYASGKKLVFDGSKIKAYASRTMLDMGSIKTKLENIDKSITEYLLQLESNDSNDDQLEVARDVIKQLKEKIGKLETQKIKLESTREILKSGGKKFIAPNDKDAVLVRGRDGKFAGYNAQMSVETKGHFIMSSEVTAEAADQHLLKGCIEKAIAEINSTPKEVLADKGYGNVTQILEAEENGIQCYIPLPETSREKEEKTGIVFQYDKQSDTYTCPQGKRLDLHSKNKKDRGAIYNVYKCKQCEGCPIGDKCTTSKTGRTFRKNINQYQIDQYKKRLESNYAKQRIKERKQFVEHPFGTIKWLMGKFNFLLTGKQKTQIEFDLYSMSYNIKRLINCGTTSSLMEKIKKYDWEMA